MFISQILDALAQQDALALLDCGRRGIEKEGLRYTNDHRLSTTPHPKTFGAPLTHKEITTDYAESLLEIVTPAFRNSRDTLDHLCYLHRVIASHQEEYLLNASMPAFIDNIDEVAISRYGSSNAGKMRRLYRQGLALRYGKPMQLIAGMHFNYSQCPDFFKHYANAIDQPYGQPFINQRYMNLVRNVRRYAWLTVYLFGHSPALDRSFFAGQPHTLETLDQETLFLPYATSLRMSDIGYQNKTTHIVTANSLKAYIDDLKTAVLAPSKIYEQLGLFDADGHYQQINTNVLQIENEYYTAIRPKQITSSGETPLKALHDRGIAYVELRTLDVNCFERTGISQHQLDFLELFMLFCLLTEAPALNTENEKEIRENIVKTACRGRDPQLLLSDRGRAVSIAEWGADLLQAMRSIAIAMDSEKHRPHYLSTIERQLNIIDDAEQTPSAQIMHYLSGAANFAKKCHNQSISYHQFITELSQKHSKISLAKGLTSAEQVKVSTDAKHSIDAVDKLEKDSQHTDFSNYLESYFAQLKQL